MPWLRLTSVGDFISDESYLAIVFFFSGSDSQSIQSGFLEPAGSPEVLRERGGSLRVAPASDWELFRVGLGLGRPAAEKLSQL